MAADTGQKFREMAARGKYQRLFTHLGSLSAQEWKTSFAEIESVLGFELPASARLHRPWWANQRGSNGHSQALAWTVAGWETADVDMEGETLSFRRKHSDPIRKPDLDEVWPVHSVGTWPAGLHLSREEIYDERI